MPGSMHLKKKMINELQTSALIDSIRIIKDNENFLSLAEKDKADLFKKIYSDEYPESLIQYFSKITEEMIFEDKKNTINIKSPVYGKLADSIIEFLTSEFTEMLEDFYSSAESKKNKFLENSSFGRTLFKILDESTYSEISETISSEIYKIKQNNIVIIESPVELSKEFKNKIRKKYLESDPFAFSVFKINEDIVGGLKILANSQLLDLSWVNRI